MIAFVEDAGTVVIDRRGAKITYVSGETICVRRQSVEDFRLFIAAGTQALHQHDAAERNKVVPLGKGRRDKH